MNAAYYFRPWRLAEFSARWLGRRIGMKENRRQVTKTINIMVSNGV
jgi:hypothetical protein